MYFGRLFQLMCAMLICLAFSPVYGEYKSVEGAVEAADIYLQTSDADEILLLDCPSCPRTFAVADDFRVQRAGQPSTLEDLREGETGTLIYNLESGEAVRILLQ